MTCLPLRIECAGLDTLDLSGPSGITCSRIDLGDPVAREVVNDAPDANGTIDTTQYFGARAVTASFLLDPEGTGLTMFALTSRLKAFTRPDLRPRLYVQFHPDDPELVLTLRRGPFADPWTPQDHDDDLRTVVVQWVCPSGLIESAELHSVTGAPGDNQPQGGATFPWTFDLTFGSSTPSTNGVVATNEGNVPAWPTVVMYGPMTDPVVLNETTGKSLTFDGLSVAAADWVRLDFAAKTIENSAGVSYYGTVDFSASEWWQLQPGDNRIFVVPATSTIPPASFDVIWRNSWL